MRQSIGDVVALAALRTAAQQNHQRLAIPSKIDPITGPAIDLYFARALADRLNF
jgi:hypothetical protein